MQIIRTIIWVVLAILLLVFSINNWDTVTIKIWENLVVETKIPALVIVSFLLGLVPMWLLHRGMKWRLGRRITALDTAVRNAVQHNAQHQDTTYPSPESTELKSD